MIAPARLPSRRCVLAAWGAVLFGSGVTATSLAWGQDAGGLIREERVELGRFDKIEIAHDDGSGHRRPFGSINAFDKGVSTVSIRPSDQIWASLRSALSGLRVHDRAPDPQRLPGGLPTNWVVRLLRRGRAIHEIGFFWTPSSAAPEAGGVVDGRKVFLNRDLPDLLQKLKERGEIRFAMRYPEPDPPLIWRSPPNVKLRTPR